MKEYSVIYDGISLGDQLIGIVWIEDIEKIFRFYFSKGIPSEIRAFLESLPEGVELIYRFPGTTDKIEICNAYDLLNYE